MGTERIGWKLHLAGLVAFAGYLALAGQAGAPDARPWLALALGLGWLALGLVIVGTRESPRARWMIVGWALLFRLVGVGTEPSWEDDYYRYLWDGYQMRETGNPYAQPPSVYFGLDGGIPEQAAEALDGINHPEVKTIYGPVAQVVFGVAAWLGLGSLLLLKCVLVLMEIAGWWSVRKLLGWRGWVLVWWCPLAVTETAFAGHPDAIGVALLALAMAWWHRANLTAATLSGVGAAAVKPFGWVLAPFVVDRFGWRSGGLMLVAVVGIYGWFWAQGSAAEWSALATMGQGFEYNSTGFALVAALMSDHTARIVSVGLTLIFAVGAWWLWRRGNRQIWPPVTGILAVAFWWAPVVNPWYALWLLPGIALRPSGWGIGVLIALPLAYSHGWGLGGSAIVNYQHPWWTRPLEVAVILVVALAGYWWQRRRVFTSVAGT